MFTWTSELTSAAASSILDKTRWARCGWGALEGARCVDAELVNPAIMGFQNAFIYVCNRQRRKTISSIFSILGQKNVHIFLANVTLACVEFELIP